MNKIFFIALLLVSLITHAQPTAIGSTGPSCQGSDPKNWNNCVGTYKFPNGNVYTGQWQNGMRQGYGKIRIVAKGQSKPNYIGSDIPSTYVGQFANNMINGHGVWTTDKGDRYEGNFVNNVMINQGSAPAPVVNQSAQSDAINQQNQRLAQIQEQQQRILKAQQDAADDADAARNQALLNQSLEVLKGGGTSSGTRCYRSPGGPSFGPTAGSMYCQ